MINTKKFAATLAMGLALCGVVSSTFAATTFTRTAVDNTSSAALAGFVTNDIKTTFTGQYTGSQALIELTGGGTLIYQDGFGTAAPPLAALLAAFPSAAFDTFTAQGSATSPGANGEPSLGGGAVDLGGAPGAVFTNASINQAWNPAGGVTILDQSNFLIGRFSLAATANGTAKFLVSAGGTPEIKNGTVTNGVISFGDVLLPTVGDLNLVAPNVNDVVSGNVALANVTTLAFNAIAAPNYTPTIPGKPLLLPNLPTLSNTGAFSWNTAGSLRGQYVWAITGTGTGTDGGLITVQVNGVPEPATLSLLGLAVVGFVGCARRRS